MKLDSNTSSSGIKKTMDWWKPIEESLLGINIKGIKVICPKCREGGFAITRWVKGPSLKPIFIFHIKNKKVRKICAMNQAQSERIRKKVYVLDRDIRSLLEKRKPFILFSGGKDSLATLAYLKSLTNGSGNNITALYVDTTAGLPENTEYIKRSVDI